MKFAYNQPNGIAAILIAAAREDIERDLGLTPRAMPDGSMFPAGLSDEEYRTLVLRAIPSDATLVHELADDWAPPAQNRTIRNAWVTDGTTVYVDLTKARDLARARVIALDHPNLVHAVNHAHSVAELLAILVTAGDTN